MYILRIEHAIRDFETWKKAFDADPAGREASGVQHYRVMRPANDPDYVLIDLDFDTAIEAERFLAAMREAWQSRRAAPALSGSPQARIVAEVESRWFARQEAP
jgi:hypothetical protein